MTSIIEAKNKVLDFLNLMYTDLEVLIMDDKTIENNSLFVFFYNSKEYLLNKDSSYALAGNGGIIVDKIDGALFITGTSNPIEYYIEEFNTNKESLERVDI